jgi:3-keto-5-aminohexanoate cleavage enzyme
MPSSLLSNQASVSRYSPAGPVAERREPLVLAVAPNGARKTRSDHPALPIMPMDLANCAAACRDAGASMVHLHVRKADGSHSLAAEDYRPAITALRQIVGDSLVIQLSSEAVGIYGPSEQMALVRELRPEAVSLALREILPNQAAEPEGAKFLAWAHREHIVAQYILYSAEDATRYAELRQRGIVPAGRHWVLFVLGRYAAGQQSSLADLLPILAAWQTAGQVTQDVRWAMCAFGSREIECALGAAALGGDVRLGFENNVQLPDGRIARDNAELLTCFADFAARLGHPLADAALLRSFFP